MEGLKREEDFSTARRVCIALDLGKEEKWWGRKVAVLEMLQVPCRAIQLLITISGPSLA